MSDYAVLVGIAHYPNPGFSDLQGPPNDVALFEEWLRSPTGGAIIDQPNSPRILKLVTPNPYPASYEPDEAPPTQYAFERQFRKLSKQLGEEPGRRLYLYFSGHGFSERKKLEAHAAVYTADADDEWPMNIFGTYYALMALRKGWFQEVVLVMDCCRDSEINRKAAQPPLDEAFDEGSASTGKLLALYGAPFGGKAQERTIAAADNTVYGLLTYALVQALRQAPCDARGLLTGQRIKEYIRETWTQLYGPDAPDLPRIQTPDGDDIVFNTPAERQGFAQRITLAAPLTDEAKLVVTDGRFEPLFTCRLEPQGQNSTIVLADGTTQPLEFDGQTLTLRLTAGMYGCEFSGNGDPRSLSLIVRGEGYATI